jgi:predicted metalloendopeptidase
MPQLNVTNNETILVLDVNYIKNASRIYSDAFKNNNEDLLNLMIWSFIKDKLISMNFLPKNYTNALRKFNEEYLNAATSVSSRASQCANVANTVMPYSLGQLYVKRRFNKKSKQDVQEMVENIREEFKAILNRTEWMDAQSKKAAIEKVRFCYSNKPLKKL